MGSVDVIQECFTKLDNCLDHADQLLDPDDSIKQNFTSQVKRLYDFMKEYKSELTSKKSNSLNELLVSGFDNEQIWQQLELQNTHLISLSRTHAEKSVKNKKMTLLGHSITTKSVTEDDDDIYSDDDDEEELESIEDATDILKNQEDEDVDDKEDNDNEEEDEDENESDDEASKKKPKTSDFVKTVVDDEFFKLRQMEMFLDEQDRLEEERRDGNEVLNEDEEIDYFKEMDEGGDDPAETKYDDYFDPIADSGSKKKAVGGDIEVDEEEQDENDDMENDDMDEDDDNAEEEEEDSEEEKGDSEEGEGEEVEGETEKDENKDTVAEGKKSVFEVDQEKMLSKIRRLEQANLSKKPWQLMGEATATNRPFNSLLEEHVTFEHTTTKAPEITEETTSTLEDLIKLRIKDRAWDDVVKKEKPTMENFVYKKAPELDMEKSKLTLAEVYEREYLSQAQGEEEEKENEEHVKIRDMMKNLFMKLDALSNFYYTPDKPKVDLKIVTNTPSLQMEEVAPITVTEASQLAPEELHKKKEVVGATEKTDEDRKRERRKKKIKKKVAAKEREAKEKKKTKKDPAKKAALANLKKNSRNTIVNEKSSANKNLTSSSKFFNQLQDEARTGIKRKLDGDKQKKSKKKAISGENIKL